MTQYLTRREMREAERAGKLVPSPAEQLEATSDSAVLTQAQVVDVPESSAALPASEEQVFMTRRERRLAEAGGAAVTQVQSRDDSAAAASEAEPSTESTPIFVSEAILAAIEEVTAESEITQAPVATEISITEFTGSNLLAEPSTQSLVLDIAPEAISLPIETLDGTSTGSISILPDPNTGTLTGSLDGLAVDTADRVDAVTGVISMVEPVSARDVISQRVTFGVVPDEALRKGFWQTWAYAALGVGLAIATIVATIAIITAIGE